VAPINSEQNININPSFTLECKWLFAQEEMRHFPLLTLLV
jgi:hypothetical protein